MSRGFRQPNWSRLMSIEAACAYLGDIGRETFLTEVAPSLRCIKLGGDELKYDRQDLDAWVEGRGVGRLKRTDRDWLRDVGGA